MSFNFFNQNLKKYYALKFIFVLILFFLNKNLYAQDMQIYQENFWKLSLNYDPLIWQKSNNIGNIFLHLQPIISISATSARKNQNYLTSLIFSARPDFDQSHQNRKKFKENIQLFKTNLSKQFNFNYHDRAGFFQHYHNYSSYQFAYDYQVGSSQLSAYTQIIACPNRLITATLMTKQNSLAIYLPKVKKILDSLRCYE